MKLTSDKSVFEEYAHEYDLMTNAAQREKFHTGEVAALIEKFKPESVLDAGCATGLTSMLFAKAGCTTVGLDRSQKMLTEARKKYGDSSYPLEFRYGQFEKLPHVLQNKFDLVVCLANSISGVHTLSGLWKSLRSFSAVMRPGGNLVLQLLNYSAIKESDLVPIKTTVNDGLMYIRFSERHRRRFFVYTVRLDMNKDLSAFEVFRHDFDNFTEKEIYNNLRTAGFGQLHKYGDLFLKNRFARTSRDLVVTAKKPLI